MSTRLTYTSGALGAETDADFESRLAAARATEAQPLPHLIAGDDVHEGEPFERLDPSRGEPASRGREGGAAAAARAADAARSAAAAWRNTPYAERCELMRAVAAGIGERHIELAAVASMEAGKSRAESILEVQEAVDLITTYAGLMEENNGLRQAAGQLRGGRAQRRRAPPLWRVRRDRAVQLPGGARDQHVRGGADRRQHGRAEAVGGDALDRGDPRRDRPRRRASRRACSTWFRAGRTPAARSWRATWTASRSPARPRSAAGSRGRSRRARSPAPRSPRWAARTRRS